MDVRVGLWRKLSAEELMLLNCGLLESPLDCKEIQPVHPKGDQSWIFIGRTDAEAETPILCPPDVKNWLIRKGPDAGKEWRQEEKGMTEDEMVGWHHRLNGHRVWISSGSWWWTGKLGMLQSMGSQSWTRLSYWTELLCILLTISRLWGLLLALHSAVQLTRILPVRLILPNEEN